MVLYINCLRSHYSTWPYFTKMSEATVHMYLHAILRGLGEMTDELRFTSERTSYLGRSDITICIPGLIYIHELKWKKHGASSEDDLTKFIEDALEQIRRKQYYLKYINSPQTVVFLVIVYDITGIISYKKEYMKDSIKKYEAIFHKLVTD